MKHLQQRAKQRGITLVELLVVLAILALISAFVVINILPERDRAATRRVEIDIRTIETALDQYNLDMFNYPSTSQGLDALVKVPADVSRKDQYRPGGYFRNGVPTDPWGNPYQYRYPGENGLIDIYSLGADGESGGEGVNADIGNWTIEQ